MNRIIAASALLLSVTAGNALAAGKTVTFFSDGALVEIESTATKGVAEIPLPAGIMEGTLRIAPINGAVIQRVELLPIRREAKTEKELELLGEQKSRLEDRMRALSSREEIFKSAAKSQSGKAPRKTKANPDPMQSIRQGTDFAIAQLEAVYTARRKTEQELRRIDARIIAARQGSAGAETVARVTLAPVGGKIKSRYALAGKGWTPLYDLRLNGDAVAGLTLYGRIPGSFAGYRLLAAPGNMNASDTARAIPITAASPARLADYRLPAKEEQSGDGLQSSFSCILTNPGPTHLPAGAASIYRKGEFRGQFRFESISSGQSRKVSSRGKTY